MSVNSKTDAALDAELFARAGAIVEVLVLKHAGGSRSRSPVSHFSFLPWTSL
jgi:hypothetical protein